MSMELEKEARIKGIDHFTGDFYPLLLWHDGKFEVSKKDLKKFGLKPEDFLNKYFKLSLKIVSGGEYLYPFEIKKLENIKPSNNEFEPKTIEVRYQLQLRPRPGKARVGGKLERIPERWLYLPLNKKEFEKIKSLPPLTFFDIKNYEIHEASPKAIHSPDSVFNLLLWRNKKEFDRRKGKYVAILNNEIVAYGSDPVALEKKIQIEEGLLYIRKVIEDTRPIHI